jgi:hypothetical protein
MCVSRHENVRNGFDIKNTKQTLSISICSFISTDLYAAKHQQLISASNCLMYREMAASSS